MPLNLTPRPLSPPQRFLLRGGGSAILRRVCSGTFVLYGDIVFPNTPDSTLAIWNAEGKYYNHPRITCELDILNVEKLK